MVETRKVTFANAAGKPLVTVREINAVGRGIKIKHVPRKSTPADLKKLKTKHEAAVRRAAARVSMAEGNLSKVKKVAANVQNTLYHAKWKMTKEKNPVAIKNLKEKINKMKNMTKNLAPKLEMLQINLNLAKNKLNAQRTTGIKKSRFTFL